jgi:hypothetical protein
VVAPWIIEKSFMLRDKYRTVERYQNKHFKKQGEAEWIQQQPIETGLVEY